MRPGKDARKGTLVSPFWLRCEHPIGVETLVNLPIGKFGGNVTHQSCTEKPPALTNRLHSG